MITVYTKKELYRLKEIGKILKKEFENNFTNMIVLETYVNIVEYFESIELLFNKNNPDSARSIYRTCLQSIANLEFILKEHDRKQIVLKANCYNLFNIQNINFKIVRLMNHSEIQTKQEMFDMYIDLLRDKFETDEFEDFQKLLLDQRDMFFSTNNKRHWFNLFEIYANEQSFISHQLGKETEYFYQVSSEFTHGNSVVFNLGKFNKPSTNNFDNYFLKHISLLFLNTTTKLIRLSNNTEPLEEHLSFLSDYFDKTNNTDLSI